MPYCDDGYIYNYKRNIRTSSSLEKLYSGSNGYLSFLWSVEFKDRDGTWNCRGSRWCVNSDDLIFVMENGFSDFPKMKGKH